MVVVCALLLCVLALVRQMLCAARATTAGYTELATSALPQPQGQQQQQQQVVQVQKDLNGNWVTVRNAQSSGMHSEVPDLS